MNIANILSLLRIVMVPFFIFFLNQTPLNKTSCLVSLSIFILASITDFFDGFIARKKNMITNLGKFLDPLADKILTTAAYLCFLNLKLVSIYIVFIILTREFLVFLIRLIASKENIVIAANFWGKLKTVTQIISCMITILYFIIPNIYLFFIYNCFIYASTFLTALSGFLYIFENKKLLKNSK